MNVAAYVPAFPDPVFRRDDVPFGRDNSKEGTTKFGMLRSAMGLVQAESNACDVSSTRSEDRPS